MPRTVKALARRIARRPQPPREIIYLVAASGAPNYGDELIARTWLQHLARTRPDADVVLDCHTPGQASIMLHGLHPRAMFVDTLWRVCALSADRDHLHSESASQEQPSWEWAATAGSALGVEPLLAEGVDLLARASVIHLLGGGYINAIWPHHLALLTAIAAVVRKSGARAVATGQGLMPMSDGPRGEALHAAVAAFELFDVRDEESHIALGSDSSQSGDDAWLALAPGAPQVYTSPDETPSGIVLCLQSDLSEHFAHEGNTGVAAIASWTANILDNWGVDGREVTVVEGIPGADRLAFDLLGPRLAGATFVPFLQIWRHGLPAGQDQTWISTRFHPHLMAAAAGASGVALVSEPGYYSTKHCSLTDAGSRWTIARDGLATPERPTAGGFSPADRAARVSAKSAVAQRLYPA
ncbi:polysaccharide pyruvyl transferase family protein [Tomitella biformata]|uniref:polysaccharide pyruvyl transferase family protein n=1 Tax=Tomitella biformata TaxID=630403 RepID=UPI000688FBDE|nr:polysaccharide pyruvyl transferase family protein [Tomitella biformata]